MEATGGRSLWLLLPALVLVARQQHFQEWPGFQEKPMSKENVNSTLDFFIQSYNNASNDTYLFRVQKLLRTQVQVSGGIQGSSAHTLVVLDSGLLGDSQEN